jgi:hypothetical protein
MNSRTQGYHALPLYALRMYYYPLGYPMPYASDVYAELSFGQGLLWPEHLNMDKLVFSSVAEKKRQNRDKTETKHKIMVNKTKLELKIVRKKKVK